MVDPAETVTGERPATAEDVGPLVATVAAAFARDPTWEWAVGGSGPEQLEAVAKFWRVLVAGALPHGWVWQLPGAAAMSVWLPPGAPELLEADAANFDDFVASTFGSASGRVQEIVNRFDEARPYAVEHFYLSLLATHPDHRGKRLGMQLLASNLARIDELGLPTYLESTNPSNLARYGSLGFEPRDEIRLSAGGPLVTTMWRPVGRRRTSPASDADRHSR